MSAGLGVIGQPLTDPPGDSGAAHRDAELFDCGTLLKLRISANPGHTRRRNMMTRALVVVLVGWAPLLVLAAVQGVFLGEGGVISLLSDVAVSCRFLVAAPLLVLAEWTCVARLGAIAHNFRLSGLVGRADDERFERAWASTLRLRNSIAADVVVVVLSYAIIGGLTSVFPASGLPAWHVSSTAGVTSYSLAGWWHAMVSLPLLFVLILTWLWRVVLWARFLFLMSLLDLRLVPSHPDHIAGLRFVGFSAPAFSPVGFALGVIAAGAAANRVLYEGATLESFTMLVMALAVTVVVVFAGPLVVFVYPLWLAWWRGTFEYGTLARRLGQELENKWLRRGETVDEGALAVPDFSATTDLYQVTETVYFLRPIPIDFFSLGALVVATLLPFLGIVLLFTPVDVVVRELAGLLL